MAKVTYRVPGPDDPIFHRGVQFSTPVPPYVSNKDQDGEEPVLDEAGSTEEDQTSNDDN